MPRPPSQHLPKPLTLKFRLLSIHYPHSITPKGVLILANAKGEHGRTRVSLPMVSPTTNRDPVPAHTLPMSSSLHRVLLQVTLRLFAQA